MMNPTAFFSQPASDYNLQRCYLNLDRKPSSKINLCICPIVLSVLTRERKEISPGYRQSENYRRTSRDTSLQSSLLNIHIHSIY